jgi:hypothetical protein
VARAGAACVVVTISGDRTIQVMTSIETALITFSLTCDGNRRPPRTHAQWPTSTSPDRAIIPSFERPEPERDYDEQRSEDGGHALAPD